MTQAARVSWPIYATVPILWLLLVFLVQVFSQIVGQKELAAKKALAQAWYDDAMARDRVYFHDLLEDLR